MRGLVVALVALLQAPAFAQTLLVGAGMGAVWERRAPVAPAKDWFHADRPAFAAFLGLPVDAETVVRLERVELPRDVVWGGERWEARLAGWTLGVDYLLPGTWGQALVAAGVGSYRLDLAAASPPAGLEDTRFGWYAKLGEWFPLTKRVLFGAEVAYHRTNHRGSPQLLAASAGLVLRF